MGAVLSAEGYSVCSGWCEGAVGVVVGDGCSCGAVEEALRLGAPVLALGRGVVCLAGCLGRPARLACTPDYCGEVASRGCFPVVAGVFVEDPVVSCVEASPGCLAEFIRMLRSYRLVGRVMWFTRGYPCRDGR